ncbi:MAG: NUDIX hydrolase, partial [Chloroflexi bacterium]
MFDAESGLSLTAQAERPDSPPERPDSPPERPDSPPEQPGRAQRPTTTARRPVRRPERSGDPLEERIVASRVLREGYYLTFRIDTIVRADGSRATREVAGHPGAVAIVALDEADRVLLVRQWRSPAGRAMLEIPAGTLDYVDRAKGIVEDHALAAPRELEEETGYRADSW